MKYLYVFTLEANDDLPEANVIATVNNVDVEVEVTNGSFDLELSVNEVVNVTVDRLNSEGKVDDSISVLRDHVVGSDVPVADGVTVEVAGEESPAEPPEQEPPAEPPADSKELPPVPPNGGFPDKK